MKLLVALCFLGLTAADFLEDAGPALDQSVLFFFQGAVKAGSLEEHLGIHDLEIQQIADDLETALGHIIREVLKDILRKLKDHAENAKEIAQELKNKAQELRDHLKDLGEDESVKSKEVRTKAKGALRQILNRLGLGKQNLDDSMDHTARMKFREIIEKIQERMTSNENIQKIREYIRELYGHSEMVIQLKQLVERLEDTDFQEILRHLFDYDVSGEQQGSLVLKGKTWDKLQDLFKDIHIRINEHRKKFGEWVKDMWSKGIDKLRGKYGVIRSIAMEFIANAKDMSAEGSREALELFSPYKDDLGSLWNKLVDATKEAIGKF